MNLFKAMMVSKLPSSATTHWILCHFLFWSRVGGGRSQWTKKNEQKIDKKLTSRTAYLDIILEVEMARWAYSSLDKWKSPKSPMLGTSDNEKPFFSQRNRQRCI